MSGRIIKWGESRGGLRKGLDQKPLPQYVEGTNRLKKYENKEPPQRNNLPAGYVDVQAQFKNSTEERPGVNQPSSSLGSYAYSAPPTGTSPPVGQPNQFYVRQNDTNMTSGVEDRKEVFYYQQPRQPFSEINQNNNEEVVTLKPDNYTGARTGTFANNLSDQSERSAGQRPVFGSLPQHQQNQQQQPVQQLAQQPRIASNNSAQEQPLQPVRQESESIRLSAGSQKAVVGGRFEALAPFNENEESKHADKELSEQQEIEGVQLNVENVTPAQQVVQNQQQQVQQPLQPVQEATEQEEVIDTSVPVQNIITKNFSTMVVPLDEFSTLPAKMFTSFENQMTEKEIGCCNFNREKYSKLEKDTPVDFSKFSINTLDHKELSKVVYGPDKQPIANAIRIALSFAVTHLKIVGYLEDRKSTERLKAVCFFAHQI